MGVARWAVMWMALILLPCMPALAQDESTTGPSQDQYQGDGCIPITTLQGNTSKETEPFSVGNTTLRIVFKTNPLNNQGFNFTIISLSAADDFSTVDSAVARNGRDGVFEVPLEKGRYIVDANNSEQSYQIIVEARGGDEPCTQAPGSEDGDDDDGDVDNPDDVVPGTAADGDLPNTGGLPLMAMIFASMLLVGSLAFLGTVVRRGS